MPDIVNDIANDDDLSALAAEYVLGTLDPDERTRANVLLDVDQGFRGLVKVWERRFGELHLMVEPVEPDGKVWERIRGKLGQPAPPLVQPESPPAARPEPTTREQKLAELIQEVEKFRELRPLASAEGAPAEVAPAEAKAADAAPPAAEPEEAREPEHIPAEPVAPSLLPAVEEMRAEVETPVRERPPRGWRAVALLMSLLAVGLSGLIAAWRFVPDRLPAPLRPMVVLNIPEVSPSERKPAEHGTAFEE